jgi:hypothetical protein
VASYLFNFTSVNAKKGVPLRTHAAELLTLGLWGIGPKTGNRALLQPGDTILAYVGAPERAFIGQATLASPTHEWEPHEKQKYPGSFTGGVAFSTVAVWDHVVPIKTVWPETTAAKKNPGGFFQGGVVRLAEEDFNRIVGAANGGAGTAAKPQVATVSKPPSETVVAGATMTDKLYAVAERLQKYLASGQQTLSEDATRAHFINRILEALGYTDFEDIEYGAAVDSGDFADYVLRVGDRVACVEAKKLGAQLGPKEAAQVVKYASVLGLRWGILTDGEFVKVYDVRVPNVPPQERLVFEVDLADYKSREDFEAQVFPPLALLAKDTIATDTGLERRAAALAVQDLLTSSRSATVAALREELKSTKLISLSSDELSEVLSDVLP